MDWGDDELAQWALILLTRWPLHARVKVLQCIQAACTPLTMLLAVYTAHTVHSPVLNIRSNGACRLVYAQRVKAVQAATSHRRILSSPSLLRCSRHSGT